ncbi:exosortase/archaeosortase family protein [Verrucomicrobiales bacterium]|nr:exosortase/archaeosortase family protein [Verrucomicrobiales bacterium]
MAPNPETNMDTLKAQNQNPWLWCRQNLLGSLFLVSITATFVYFYWIIPIFGNFREQSVIEWMWAICGKEEYDYGHGRFVPFVIIFLIIRSRKKILSSSVSSQWWGLALLLLGILFYIVSVRTIQARIAAGSIPFIIYGFLVFVWGKKTAKHFIFPLALLYFAIPLPGLIQATNGLQIIATKIAYHISTIFGADVVAGGTEIQSANGSWDALKIAEGCSGVRSLIALVFIASIYGHMTQNKIWKLGVLIISSVPLAILANSFRVTTIVLIAEFWDAEFASQTYHNFSGFIFFPLGLLGLMLVGFLINSGWKKKNVTVTTNVVSEVNSKNGSD